MLHLCMSWEFKSAKAKPGTSCGFGVSEGGSVVSYFGPSFKFKKEYLDAESKDKVLWPGGESTHGHL